MKHKKSDNDTDKQIETTINGAIRAKQPGERLKLSRKGESQGALHTIFGRDVWTRIYSGG